MNVYVPYRPGARPLRFAPTVRVPYRGGLGALGAGGSLVQSAGTVYSGAAAGSLIGAGTSVAGAIGGAAAAGSFVPVIGTAIGAVIGLVLSGVFNHRVDPEVGNFNAAVSLFNQQGVNGIMNIADKYLVLAGLFDLEPSQIKGNIPIYKKYGRMGEAKFVTDMCNLIYQAAQDGRITANDTVQTVYNNIVAPWIASFGYGSMQDTNGEMITNIIIGLIAEYITGLYKQRWFARSGDFPVQFGSIPAFGLPASAAGQSGQVTPVGQVPTAQLPTNSTPAPPESIYGSPAYMAAHGYSQIGIDPSWGAIYASTSGGPPVVISNGQIIPYPQQVPSVASQVPSLVSQPLPVSVPVQQAAPNVNYAPPVQYQGGGPVPYTDPNAAAPVQAASVAPTTTNPWLIAGAAVAGILLLMGFKQQPQGSRR